MDQEFGNSTNVDPSVIDDSDLDLFVEEIPGDSRYHLPVNCVSTIACECSLSTLSSFSC